MTKGALGRWAVRFLAAAGVSSAACSGRVEINQGAVAGGGGAVASNGASAGRSAGADVNAGVVAGGGETVAASGASPSAGATAGGAATDVGGDPDPGGGAGGGEQLDANPANKFPCLNPEPYGNAESGLELCDNGMIHRVSVGTCDVAAPGSCLVDEDCPPTNATWGTWGTICACDANGVGACVPAACALDADCDAGFSCVAARRSYCIDDTFTFACQTENDQCGTSADCSGDPCVWRHPDAPVHTCGGICGVAGRPFLIDAGPRTARTEPGSAWLEPLLRISSASLAPELRARLTAHWQHQAEMEHASVAAFARFVLELLSLGAPPELVSAATSALADETAHARTCYALASGYAGHSLGPAKLDVTGALGDLSLEAIVTRAVLEGCVGETLAAVDASEAASHAHDETLRAVLARIAEDEARHAELSWRFLRWAWTQGGAQLGSVVRSAFGRARADLALRGALSRNSTKIDLMHHGVLSSEHSARLALQVFDMVIEPCVNALLATAGDSFSGTRSFEDSKQVGASYAESVADRRATRVLAIKSKPSAS